MTLTHIYHSGFAIESDRCSIIFDYFKDSEDGFIRRSLPALPGALYVLSSHWHPDHFNPEILQWRDRRPDLKYVFSKDILKKRLATADDATFLVKGEVYEDGNLRIKAFGSTDAGVSFLVETSGLKIFHAGDLNNWHWDEESTPAEILSAERHYLKELKELAADSPSLDLVMFPVDCRLGKNYMLGAQQFVAAIKTANFAPMHFGETFAQANAFRPYAEQAGARFIELNVEKSTYLLEFRKIPQRR
jgi:L-ascorbate metabolism protein UlaG (beta-lactamase superfamily)